MKKPKQTHSQTVQKPTPAFARLLEEADQGIRLLEPGNPYRLYEFLHGIARRIAPVDAFHVCLYSPTDKTLFFPYNVEGDVYDPPVTLPLDDSSASQIIREGIPLVWNCETQARTVKDIIFGQTNRFSHSAMQVPIRAQSAKAGLPPLGVLSCHAYRIPGLSPGGGSGAAMAGGSRRHGLDTRTGRGGLALPDEGRRRNRNRAAAVFGRLDQRNSSLCSSA